ncbi:helix-turn-helix domain-containing protein [Mycoplasma enhydrae]|uniref:helix-turn-helix domain-containing protein n=1 Tax=Mycoplasma enhydrae TaxID=2499220 RepID=UPI00197C2FF7|nr:helix-turn-helix transcriptional regulator [Mycoplasma enhydrae]MBN4089528.1 helix-turn-helix transcriptional regulator [Mycoplasma enhydrae]MCV3733627.1 helix-turn-helix domain-containing protein [Mycoplasma enhydrae]MCV3753392.1 helix-turn-helix domain-containing protein [Mycoplasma enhydrae]
MNLENLKNIEQKTTNCMTFGQFLKAMLKTLNINATKVAEDLCINKKILSKIINDNKKDINLNLIQSLEEYFNLEIGYLTKKWYFYKNKKLYDYDLNESESLIKMFGWEVLENNPQLFDTITNFELRQEYTIEEKMNLIKRFFGTLDPQKYLDDIQKHMYLHKCNIFKPYRLPFIRYCELFIKECYGDFNGKNFKPEKNMTKGLIMKVFAILFNNNYEFYEKLEKVQEILSKTGTEIIKIPYVNKSFTRAISFNYGKKKYIILTDMYNSEMLILYALMREIFSWFYPALTKDEYSDIFKKYYNLWKNRSRSNKSKMADDIVDLIERISLLDKKAPDFYKRASILYNETTKKWKIIRF